MWKTRTGGKPSTLELSRLVWFHRKNWKNVARHSFRPKPIMFTRSAYAEREWVELMLGALSSHWHSLSFDRFPRRNANYCTNPSQTAITIKPIWFCTRKLPECRHSKEKLWCWLEFKALDGVRSKTDWSTAIKRNSELSFLVSDFFIIFLTRQVF